MDELKSEFPDQLRLRHFSADRISSIMAYWPEKRHCKQVRAESHTLKQLEGFRATVDVAQAAKTCKNLGEKLTAQNLRPYLHKSIIEHINDTRENLPGRVIDLREPQDGLPLRTFRRHYPISKNPQKAIIAEIDGHNAELPCTAEKPETGKSPVRA